MVVAGQVAVCVQVPVLLIIWTWAVAGLMPVTAPTVQIPAVPEIVGATPAFVMAVTGKLTPLRAEASAPVKLTAGVALAAVVD